MNEFFIQNRALIISVISAGFGFFTGHKMKKQQVLSVEIANLQKVRDEEEDYVNYLIKLLEKYKDLSKENLIVIDSLKEKLKNSYKTIDELKSKIKTLQNEK
jgi:archaellum biogenesis ATPase FlaH